ncbi:basement membrane-specific heparan sulfate proteoglycan core protein-like isoform X2 [Haliotis asinina]|uniref:basement membrane-specific heparan sulfate proteoglycan core protein-like isoform X2 n=1 Tax=Haliotis asinina TaxID=109174 RepID=UPI003531D750
MDLCQHVLFADTFISCLVLLQVNQDISRSCLGAQSLDGLHSGSDTSPAGGSCDSFPFTTNNRDQFMIRSSIISEVMTGTVTLISWWLFTGVSYVCGLTLITNDRTATKGPHSVDLQCEYVLARGETLFSITMSRKRAAVQSFTDIAVFRPNSDSSLYAQGVTQDFKDRTTIMIVGASTVLRFDRVECEDEAAYKCTASYQTVGSTLEEAEMNLHLLAEPLTPTITLSPPTSTGYTEGQQVEFLCQGAVGKPAGHFLWFRYRDNTPVDITSLARLNPPYPSTGTCTSERISQLILNMGRLDNGMTIRCAANHTTLTKPTGFERCNSTCRQTDTITVFYTFRDSDPDVSSNPSGGTHTVGDTVTLKCNAVTNPPATYTWRKDGTVNSTSSGDELILSYLQIEDSGTYTCLATNVVGGVTYNVSKSLNINVVPTTTSPPTTTATSAQRPSPESTGAVKPDNTVVVVVCVVFGVLMITGTVIGVVISIKRRNKKAHEEERPYTTLQHRVSVPHEYGVIMSDTTRATCTSPSTEERPYTTLQHEASVPHEYGIIRKDTTQATCTSPSTDGPIYDG